MKRYVVAAIAGIALILPGTAAADPDPLERFHRHEQQKLSSGPPGDLVADNFDVVGHSNLVGGAPHGDVWFHDHGGVVGKHAYVGTWSSPCTGTGVKVVDVNDPAKPKVVSTAGRQTGSSFEDAVVRRIGDRDILGVGLQVCGPGGLGGLALFDVTDPRRPDQLSFFPVPAGGVHELDLVERADGTALAVLAVPFVEFFDTYFGTADGGEFRVVDITDPASPVEIADWGVIRDSNIPLPSHQDIADKHDTFTSSFQGLGYFATAYAHSARLADEGQTAYVSYWDAGVLKFDLTDPTDPQLVGRTVFPLEADGDAHSVVPYDVNGTRYLLQNDEDFDTPSIVIATSNVTGMDRYAGIDEPWMPTLLSERWPDPGALTSTVHDAGDGCAAADFAGAAGRIALVDTVDPFYVGILPDWTVPCTIGSQVLLAAAAGADAVLFNLISPDQAWPFFRGDLRAVQREAVGMPAVMISDIDGMADRLRDALAAEQAVTVTLDPQEPSWGFIRVFQETGELGPDGVTEFVQVGEFSDLPHVTGELVTPPGTWSVHNTEVLGNRAYSSWYSHGVVALDLSDPTAPARVGQFVPPTGQRKSGSLGVGAPEVWGVAIDPETGLIYASEMRSGLWIVRPTDAAAPTN
jgi:hypothetical protein